jgi:predicted permease
MIKNYFKTAFRNLWRNRNYATINIAGLAAGIAVCLIIFIIIRYEKSFDDYHKKKDRIYRVLTEYHHADAADIFYGKGVPWALPGSLQTNFSEVEKMAPIFSQNNDQLLVLDANGQTQKKFKEEKGVFFTTPAFFDIFDCEWLAGSASSLKDPDMAVLTKSTAEKYFGDWKKAVGQSIRLNNSNTLKVTGVLNDIPQNSDMELKVVVSFGTGFTAYMMKSTEWDGTGGGFGCYVLLPENVSVSSFNSRLRTFVKKMKSPENKDSHIIEPLSSVHYSKAGNFSGRTISPELIRALWIIAGFILLIACVNFINLATAQAVNRSKEVGVRKVLGSNRTQLKLQFLIETFLIVLSAIVLAIIISAVSIPLIGKILDLSLSVEMLYYPSVILFLIAVTVVVTLLAGFYPSIVLSRFSPIAILKNKLTATTRGISLRRALVVLQFVIAQALIVGTLIMLKQMNYFTKQSLGFDKTAILNVPFPTDSIAITQLDHLKKELTSVSGIQNISFSTNTPVEDNDDNWTNIRFDHAIKESDYYAINKGADHEYVPTYKLALVAGRNIQASDTAREFLINEALLKKLNITDPQKALNKEINLWNGQIKGPIVGVLKDFNNRSFRAEIAPLLVSTYKNWYTQASIKLNTADASPTIASIEKIWNNVYPDFVFESRFLDEKVESFYREEKRLSQLYQLFAVIAILLSCLGLYGLASFMAVQRIKEVGIRKVLGASAANIVVLFSKEFIALIAIAFVIASPIAWYFMNQWLQDYQYRISISWWIFLLGGLASVMIALLTVSFQAIRAAVANPVKSLRSE